MIDRLDNFKNIPEATRTVVMGERRLKWGSGNFFCAYQRRHDWGEVYWRVTFMIDRLFFYRWILQPCPAPPRWYPEVWATPHAVDGISKEHLRPPSLLLGLLGLLLVLQSPSPINSQGHRAVIFARGVPDQHVAHHGLHRSAASRGAPAVSRRRGDSFPRIMAVGGFFFDFELIRTASSPVSGATGETFRTAL